jgi:hypothetical protein
LTGNRNVRIALGVVVVATLAGLSIAGFAAHSGAQPLSSGTAMVCPAVEGARHAVACGFPSWCCPTGSLVPGITVTGQATLKGSSAQIRNQAITEAVIDARQQAEAAASAAGVKLGRVIAMQISSSGYPYVMASGIEAAGAAQASPPTSSRSTLPATTAPSGMPCPAKGDCVSPAPVPVQTYVSVTVTWALA